LGYQTFVNPLDLAWKQLMSTGLSEDGWTWDWTTLGTLGNEGSEKIVRAKIVAKANGVWASLGLIAATNSLAERILVNTSLKDGQEFKSGETLVHWEGPARIVLAYERPFLNLASYASGIATSTRKLVLAAKSACPDRSPRVTATRKILPAYRDIAIAAVIAGGGHSHRVNLSGGVLIKENHVAAAGGIAAAIRGARSIAPHGLKIETEVRNEKELREALEAKVDGVLLDNFTPEQIRSALLILASSSPRPVVEVSGGINDSNIREFAIEGVDVISVGSLTHTVRATDLSMLMENT
jgi:nicotinate-nucleotide pyrophosphorylase (carboxylating)